MAISLSPVAWCVPIVHPGSARPKGYFHLDADQEAHQISWAILLTMATVPLRSALFIIILSTLAFTHTYSEAMEYVVQRYAAIVAAIAARDAATFGKLAAVSAVFLMMFGREMIGQAREIRDTLSEVIPAIIKRSFWVTLKVLGHIINIITGVLTLSGVFGLSFIAYNTVFPESNTEHICVASLFTVVLFAAYFVYDLLNPYSNLTKEQVRLLREVEERLRRPIPA